MLDYTTKRELQNLVQTHKMEQLEKDNTAVGPVKIVSDSVSKNLHKLVRNNVLYLNEHIQSTLIDPEFNKLYGLTEKTNGELSQQRLNDFISKHGYTLYKG